jgi:putative ubiquitin-RnfH superfamily antitoxin RatB of RatAB toxin-antitoxin module
LTQRSSATDVLHITVVVSPAPRVVHERQLTLPAGSTVQQALQASGLLSDFPELDLNNHAVWLLGIWGRKTTPAHVLRDLDRVELYRPLTVDPKVARRERFQKQGTQRAGLFAKRRAGAKAGY